MNSENKIEKNTNKIISKIKELEQELKKVEIGSVRSSKILQNELPKLLLKAEAQAKKHLSEAKVFCLASRDLWIDLTSKLDLEVYWKISDCLIGLERILEVKRSFHDHRLYFSNRKIDSKWFNSNRGKKEFKLIEFLTKAGKLALENYENVEIRKMEQRDKENYLIIFKHIWGIKELLNIQPDEKSYHLGFGVSYDRAKELAEGGNE